MFLLQSQGSHPCGFILNLFIISHEWMDCQKIRNRVSLLSIKSKGLQHKARGLLPQHLSAIDGILGAGRDTWSQIGALVARSYVQQALYQSSPVHHKRPALFRFPFRIALCKLFLLPKGLHGRLGSFPCHARPKPHAAC